MVQLHAGTTEVRRSRIGSDEMLGWAHCWWDQENEVWRETWIMIGARTLNTPEGDRDIEFSPRTLAADGRTFEQQAIAAIRADGYDGEIWRWEHTVVVSVVAV